MDFKHIKDSNVNCFNFFDIFSMPGNTGIPEEMINTVLFVKMQSRIP